MTECNVVHGESLGNRPSSRRSMKIVVAWEDESDVNSISLGDKDARSGW